MLTIDEARALYAQDGMAREIALREYSEEEILNDYTSITTLPDESETLITPTVKLYSRLYEAYKRISKGRPIELDDKSYHLPKIILSMVGYRPRNRKPVGEVEIDGKRYSIFIEANWTTWEGRLGFENDGVYCGSGLSRNRWCFRDKAQAEHFVKHFYKELIQVELGDLYTIKFINE